MNEELTSEQRLLRKQQEARGHAQSFLDQKLEACSKQPLGEEEEEEVKPPEVYAKPTVKLAGDWVWRG